MDISAVATESSALSALIESVAKSVVVVRTGSGHGAGVVWTSAGLIVTNAHVASRTRAAIDLASGETVEADVLARDTTNDLALLQTSDASLKPHWRCPAQLSFSRKQRLEAIVVADSDRVRVGDFTAAIGHPLGVRNAVAAGIVSGMPRAASLSQMEGNSRTMTRGPASEDRPLIEADLRLAPGNSGGPLVNARGEMIGIASMIASPGIALAVPSNIVTQFVLKARAALERRIAA